MNMASCVSAGPIGAFCVFMLALVTNELFSHTVLALPSSVAILLAAYALTVNLKPTQSLLLRTLPYAIILQEQQLPWNRHVYGEQLL